MEERIVAGVSRARLAAALRLSSHGLRDYEVGERQIPAAVLANACRLLRLRISRLVYQSVRPSDRWRGSEDLLRWVGVPRPPSVLSQREFAQVHPVLHEWKRRRGELTADVPKILSASGLLPRTYVLRPRQRSSHLVIESHAYGVAHILPCEGFMLVGREFHDMHDSEYGAWITEPYAEASWSQEVRIEIVRSLISTAAGPTLMTRYDRVLLPWRRGSEEFVMALSLRRERPRPVLQDSLQAALP